MQNNTFSTKSFLKSSLLLSLGSGVAQMVAVLTPVVLIKYYTPDSVGRYSFLVLGGALLSILLTFRAESVLLVIKDNEDSESLASLALKYSLCVGASLQAILFLLYFLNLWPFFEGFLFIPITAIAIVFFQISRELQVKRGRYAIEGVFNSSRAVLGFIAQFSLGLLNLAFTGLAAPRIITDFLYFFCSLIQKPPKQVKSSKALIVKYRPLILPMFYSRILANLSNNLISFYWPIFFSFKSLGVLYLALKITQLPGNVLGENLSKIFEKSFMNDEVSDHRKAILYGTSGVLVFSLIGISAMLLFLDPILALFKKPEWGDVTIYCAMFSPIIFTTLISASLISVFKMSQKIALLNRFDFVEMIIKNAIIIVLIQNLNGNIKFIVLIYSLLSLGFSIAKLTYAFFCISPSEFKSLSKA